MNDMKDNQRAIIRAFKGKAPLFDSLLPFMAALACARAWVSITFAGTPTGLGAPSMGHVSFDIAFSLLSLVVVIGSRRMLPFFSQRWSLPLAFGCMLAASVCWGAQLALALPSTVAWAAGAVLGGVGFATFLLLWSETLCGLNVVRIVLYTSAGMLGGSIIAFFVEGLDLFRIMFAVPLLPCAAFFALTQAHRSLPDSARQVAGCPHFRHPWRLYALFGIWAFAYGLRSDQLATGAGMHSSLSTAIVALALFLFVLLFADRFGLRLLYRSPVLLLICGFLLIPAEGLIGQTASSYLISMGYTLMSTLIALLLYDISKRLGIAIVAMVSVKNALQFLVGAGGALSSLLDRALPASADAIVALSVVAVLVLSMFLLFSERELASKWGVTVLGSDDLVGESLEDDGLVKACQKLGSHYGLSPREREILTLVAQGKTGRQIAEELYIAEGTCKAHTRHIYEKMGIHSRKELHAIVGAAREESV